MSESQLASVIEETRKLLSLSQFKEALKLLKSKKNTYINNVNFLQIFGEVYLENGKVEKAYEFLEKACNLDIDGVYGSDKFFYLGQIIGGFKGIEFIDHGIAQLTNKLQQENDPTVTPTLIKKLNQGIFAEIEIWMTDLCMEPEAESKCDELINQSLSIDETNPESWSLLASIRISQQRNDDAQKAVEKSWELFDAKKSNLEDIANGVSTSNLKEVDVSAEYVELIQPLTTLSRLAIELGLYELGGVIASNIRDIDEDNVESYYLEGFANYLYIKKDLYDLKHSIFDPDTFENFTIDNLVNDEKYKENVKVAQLQLSFVLKLSQNFDVDEDILDHSKKLLSEIGGPVEVVGGADDGRPDVNEDNWEDIIQSDEE